MIQPDVIHIADAGDPRIAPFRALDRMLNTRADRREQVAAGRFVAEGELVVQRALDAGCRPAMAFVDSENVPAVVDRFDESVEVYGADEDVRRAGMGLGVPLSIVALFHRPAPVDPYTLIGRRRLMALEAVDNPVNVGTVVRSAAALGWSGMLLDRTSADPLARRALRVAMGNAFALPFARSTSLAATLRDARDRGALVVAMTPAAGAVPLEGVLPGFAQPVVLVIGSERNGLSEELLDVCSVRAAIPMAEGVDSLNAAAAAAVACYALRPIARRRQR
ncbi:MAG: putative methyltransferase [Ilumatobacteraceae bacterium]|nr:putative methyltransferase [Ilumatobacteraceae bacterium]